MKPLRLSSDSDVSLVTGLISSATGTSAALLLQQPPPSLVVLVATSRRVAEDYAEDIQQAATLLNLSWRPEVSVLPPPPDFEAPDSLHFEQQCDLLTVLSKLQQQPSISPLLIATTPVGLCQPLPSVRNLSDRTLNLTRGQPLQFSETIHTLAHDMGYDAEAVCELPGQYAVRGGLIDVYPVNLQQPVRLDFFGDELDTIRSYDPATQRSESQLETVSISPVSSPAQAETDTTTLADWLPESITWLWLNLDQLSTAHHSYFSIPERIESRTPNLDGLLQQRQGRADRWLLFNEFSTANPFLPAEVKILTAESKSLENTGLTPAQSMVGLERSEAEHEVRQSLLQYLTQMQQAGAQVQFHVRTSGEKQQLLNWLDQHPAAPRSAPISLSNLARGFILEPAALPVWPKQLGKKLIAVTEWELFGRFRQRVSGLPKRRLPQRAQVDQLLDFSELADGDYLVHLLAGICIYRGMTTIGQDTDSADEVISLEFDAGVMLHLRLRDAHLLSRYVGLSKSTPKLGKLGSGQWEKARAAAEKATLDYAADLLHLQAKRDAEPGHAFAADDIWQQEFEKAFPFQETVDQLAAIDATKQDMEKASPMDRLICGDVGFGKTEVALRAACKAALDGKQTAVLIPTTVLAQQHFQTFKQRFATLPVVVEMLSRFRTPAEQARIIAQLEQGKIDIVIGTHSLLAKRVKFKDLGLLIIDEEHRFGVRHKERLKQMRASIDILSMSATPIPRTLYLALMGARDLSVIETPPNNRLPIQTLVRPYSHQVVTSAIQFEYERGGQVFYLHNRVATIEAVADRIRQINPRLRVAVGHGQMAESTLEKIMTRFVAGEYDVLVCTTIIESGLDIPNANTLIIEGADRFGLAQLYQIRGRVGRFNRQAYAYLLLHRHAQLLNQAHKRLSALRQHNQLGAGFRIAMRDLELRGAGNILGAKQSGHIVAVGFDLYCQLLRQSISRLKGEPQASLIRATIRLDFINQRSPGETSPDDSMQAEPSATLPVDYIPESRLRVDFYRKLALASQEKEVDELASEFTDRFGKPPLPVAFLLQIHRIRVIAENAGITEVETDGNRLKCKLARPEKSQFIMVGARFPRLEQTSPAKKLQEILTFLKRWHNNQLAIRA